MVHIVRQYALTNRNAVVAEIPGTTIDARGQIAYLFKRLAGYGQLGLAEDRLIAVGRFNSERVGTCILSDRFSSKANIDGVAGINNDALLTAIKKLRDHGDHDDVKGFDIRVYKLRAQQGFALTYRTNDAEGPITVRYFDNANNEIVKDRKQPRYRELCKRLSIAA